MHSNIRTLSAPAAAENTFLRDENTFQESQNTFSQSENTFGPPRTLSPRARTLPGHPEHFIPEREHFRATQNTFYVDENTFFKHKNIPQQGPVGLARAAHTSQQRWLPRTNGTGKSLPIKLADFPETAPNLLRSFFYIQDRACW